MALPDLPDVNRTKFELIQSIVQKSVHEYVADVVKKQELAGKIVHELPSHLIQKPMIIQDKFLHVLVEDHKIRDVEQMGAFVNKTLPLLLPPSATATPAYEGIWKLHSIITDWRVLPVSSHITLGSINACVSYNHGVLCLRSFVVGNFVDCCFHASVAGWNAYRTLHQFVNIANPLDTSDMVLEAVSLTLTSSVMKIKKFFTKARKLGEGIELAACLITTISGSPFVVESSEEGEQMEPNFQSPVENYESTELETLLHVLMIEFD